MVMARPADWNGLADGQSWNIPAGPRWHARKNTGPCMDCERVGGDIIRLLCRRCYKRRIAKGVALPPSIRVPHRTTDAEAILYYADTSGGEDACWPWTGKVARDGYGRVARKGRQVIAHRLSWSAANGVPIPDGMFVLHSCHNKLCVNPNHLRIGTHCDNMMDMVAAGRSLRGERHPHSSLTNAAVVAIRAASGPQKEIAGRFGISQSAVSFIKNRKRWPHLVEEEACNG